MASYLQKLNSGSKNPQKNQRIKMAPLHCKAVLMAGAPVKGQNRLLRTHQLASNFNSQLAPWFCVFRRHVSEADILLEVGRKRAAGHAPANLSLNPDGVTVTADSSFHHLKANQFFAQSALLLSGERR